MPTTGIEWTDRAWPVVNGCRRVSPGCENCWAERLTATRLRHNPRYKGLAVYGRNGPRWTGKWRLALDLLDEPLRVKKPQRWFVANKGDLFGEEVSDDAIAAVFGVMAACPQHTFQVLTKRAERMAQWFTRIATGTPDPWTECHTVALLLDGEDEVIHRRSEEAPGRPWPLPNVWIGVSVEDRARLSRLDELVKVPAAVRWASLEPLLEDLGDLSRYLRKTWRCVRCSTIHEGPQIELAAARCLCGVGAGGRQVARCLCGVGAGGWQVARPLDWCVVGGESGPGARPCDVADVRSVVKQCRAAAVPVFVKQLGAYVLTRNDDGLAGTDSGDWNLRDPIAQVEEDLDGTRDGYQGAPVRVHLDDRKGGDPSEWPEDLRVREFPQPRR